MGSDLDRDDDLLVEVCEVLYSFDGRQYITYINSFSHLHLPVEAVFFQYY